VPLHSTRRCDEGVVLGTRMMHDGGPAQEHQAGDEADAKRGAAAVISERTHQQRAERVRQRDSDCPDQEHAVGDHERATATDHARRRRARVLPVGRPALPSGLRHGATHTWRVRLKYGSASPLGALLTTTNDSPAASGSRLPGGVFGIAQTSSLLSNPI
jgi:hypothetical protein